MLDTEIDELYEYLDSITEEKKEYYALVMRDMNAKIGQDWSGRKSMGKLHIGLTNENGERVVRLANKNKF